MRRTPPDPSRRKLLRTLAGLPVLGASGDLLSTLAEAGSSPEPIVAIGRREGILADDGRPDPEKLDDALGRGISRAAGEESPVDAMRRLFHKNDVVGIKVNCLAGRNLSPHPDLVARLVVWLEEAGVNPANIVVFERSDRELVRAGFEIVRKGSTARCFGIDNRFDWNPREWGPGGSCFAELLVDDLTALINVGVLKDHDLAGVSIGLKNWYGVIHNPNKHHDEGCAPFIHHLAAFPLIRKKLRLTVVDGTNAQCQGGPAWSRKWAWRWNGILASVDPVAVDAVGWGLIEERRAEVGLPSLAEADREPVWIAAAGKLGLGVADPKRIRIEKV
jgi:uncharacterized protein (DUF362 family)